MRLVVAGATLCLTALVSSVHAQAGPRFIPSAPLTALPPIQIDKALDFQGPAKIIAKGYNLQARMLWIDATANIEKYNTEQKVVDLVKKIKSVGFNTIALDVKPISGQVIYPSAFAPKLIDWRGQKTLPANFDPVSVFVRECKRVNLTLFATMNAFSEGHRLINVGPGFARPAEQSVVLESSPVVVAAGQRFAVSTTGELNKLQYTATPPTPGPRSADAFSVTVRANGQIVDGYEPQVPNSPVPTVPKNGFVLYGEGSAAAFLRANAKPGEKISMAADSRLLRLPESSDKQYPLMMQPSNPAVRGRMVNMAQEFMRNYDVAGIIFDDRLRYTGLNGDFSDSTRAAFEKEIGHALQWPDDVFRPTYSLSMTKGIEPGPFWDQWLAWRPKVLRSFVREIRSAIQEIRPEAQVGVYAGSWIGEYPLLGNNWADPRFEGGIWYYDDAYRESGMAPDLDLLVLGCYYTVPTIFEAMRQGRPIGATVEASGTLGYRAVRDSTWTVAGLSLIDFKDDPDALAACLQAAVQSSNGVMVFDLSHDIDPMWPVFERAFRTPMLPPYYRRSYLADVRRRKMTNPPQYPPVILANGIPGIGQ